MASLNLSINGPSIKSSYAGVVNGPPPSSSSPTYAQWALFSVQAPLLNAFQDSGAKESILKVQETGDGELADLVEDFNEGRIQFAFVKVKDPNSGLPKSVLIAWCGGGVPERTKGYFTSHLNAVSKILHGYHVQITARSDSDLEPDAIMRKVADASGAKYSAGSSGDARAAAPPPVKSKPVFTPTTSSRVNPLVAARSKRDDNVDQDGWGADAPPVTRTQLEKVDSAYKPTKVNIADLTKQPSATSYNALPKHDDTPSHVVKGGYQPVGKVDIAAIRAQAQKEKDDRPAPVKGAYEPVGKVDIAAIRARAQKPAEESSEPEPPKPVADRKAAFSQPAQSERLTSLPKPKVANKFGGASTFTGTKAPTPGGLGFGSPAPPKAAPVGAASRTFADQGGKTPAQLWAEKKARESGGAVPSPGAPAATSPVTAQKSGSEWKSGYSGKSWAPVQTTATGRSAPGEISRENTGEAPRSAEGETPSSPAGGVSALRDRFKNTAPIGAPAPPSATRGMHDDEPSPPPPIPDNSRPSGGFQLPGLPSRPAAAQEEEEEAEDPTAYQTQAEREPSPEPARSPSPVRIAVPVSRGPEPPLETPEEQRAPPPLPPSQIDVPHEDDLEEDGDAGRRAAGAVAEQTFEPEQVHADQQSQGGHTAVVQYDYEKAEENEIDLIEGHYVTNIDMVDEDWWMGTNFKGESGLFPSNYVEIVEDGEEEEEAPAPPPPAPVAAEPTPAQAPPPAAAAGGPTATALYDYEAAEDNELSFPEDAKVTDLEFPDEDWWFGHYRGESGLFPANYVQLDS
ncbi:Fc.00g069510.m01.CDS01 [Cosmosporella sp. VM-42]